VGSIEREFERIGALVTRDLEGYPALQRKLLEEITASRRTTRSARFRPRADGSRRSPPSQGQSTAQWFSGYWKRSKRSVARHPRQGLADTRTPSRGTNPERVHAFWRSLDKKTFGQVDKKHGLPRHVSKHRRAIEKYEQINKKTDKPSTR